MTTLTSPPLAPLLEKLFRDADATTALLRQRFATLSAEERTQQLKSDDYLAVYGKMGDFHLPVSADTGRLLYMLARSCGARSIVEFGTSFGISTLHLAAALRDNGGGRVITSEFEASKLVKARENFAAAGLSDLVEIRAGDAVRTLATGLPNSIDLVLLDGAKSLYIPVLTLLEPVLRPGAMIVADNSDLVPEYLSRVRAAGSGYVSVPLGHDVELSMRV